MHKIQVSSEIGTLKQVLIHSPDGGMGNILTSKLGDWLHDDIVDVEKMQEEYDQFVATILLFLHPEVLFTDNKFQLDKLTFNPEKDDYIGHKTDCILDTQFLLAKIFQQDLKEHKGINTIGLIEGISAIEGLHSDRKKDLKQLYLNSKTHKKYCMELAKTFITGKLKYQRKKNREDVKQLKEPNFIFPPIPNFIFTRDIGITINNFLLVIDRFFRL